MEYKEFAKRFEEELREQSDGSYHLIFFKIEKDDNVTIRLSALNERSGELKVIMISNLRQICSQNMKDELDKVIRNTVGALIREVPPFTNVRNLIEDWNIARDYIFPRLAASKGGSQKPEECVQMDFLDMKIWFAVVIPGTEDDSFRINLDVTEELLEEWKIQKESLLEAAMENLKKEECQIWKITEVLKDLKLEGENQLYCMTNKKMRYGAALMLLTSVLNEFAERNQSDVVIIPSSIHEALLLPLKEMKEVKGMNQMVKYVNKIAVKDAEVLSDHCYLFRRSTLKVENL